MQTGIIANQEVVEMSMRVVNVFDEEGFENTPVDSSKFGSRIAPVGQKLGLEGLGCMFVTVQPGRRAFPFHNHLGNDEMFVILSGSGTYRYGDAEHSVKAGDVCAAPRGGPDTAHQLINTGKEELKYLGISTMRDPEVVEYPDSGKFAALAIKPGPDFMRAHLRYIGRAENSLGYYEGEDT